jgi:HlyD family secretion protein
VLLVPNAALRFTPPARRGGGGGFVSNLLPRPPSAQRRNARGADADGAAHQVWTPGPDGPRALAVRTGLSNGRQTEVTGGDLQPGMTVITDVQEAAK